MLGRKVLSVISQLDGHIGRIASLMSTSTAGATSNKIAPVGRLCHCSKKVLAVGLHLGTPVPAVKARLGNYSQ